MRKSLALQIVGLLAVLGCDAVLAEHRHETALVPSAQRATRIVVDKSERTLWLYRNNEVLKKYTRIKLGPNPIGHKEKSGDGKTPVGTYEITERKIDSDYHLALRVSYPNAADRERAKKAGVNPGGDIMVHGAKGGMFWSRGCIALSNKEIDEIFPLVAKGTPIEIRE